MNKSIALHFTLLLSLLATSETLSAQNAQPRRADTLRRELTVMTEETVVLGIRQPQDLAYSVPSPRLTPTRYNYLDTPIPYALRPAISPLGALGTMKGGIKDDAHRGYLTVAGGIGMNLRAGAGYRIVSTKEDLFDAYGRFLWGNNANLNDLLYSPKAKEHTWSLGTYYRHQFEDPTLELRAGWQQHGHNYYGLGHDLLVGNPGGAGLRDLMKLSTGRFDLDARLSLPEDLTEDWLYDGRFHLTYAGTRYSHGARSTPYKPTEWLPSLSLNLSNRLSGTSRWGVMGDLSLSILNFPLPPTGLTQETAVSSNRMILSAAPYLLSDDVSGDFSWRLLGGLRLLSGGDRNASHLYLFPKVDASLTYSRYLQLRLETDAELHRLGLGDMQEVMPYLDAYTFPDRLERTYWGKLSLSTTIADRFNATAFARYSGHRNAAQFRPFLSPSHYVPSPSGYSDEYSSLSFTPYYAGYRELSFGLDLAFNHRGLFQASLGGEFMKYLDPTDLLSGKPEYRVKALAELNFIPRTSLRIGYDITGAVSYYNLSNPPYLGKGTQVKLSAAHLLHADFVYQLTKSLSLTAEARALLLGLETQWFGYHQQPPVALIGLQYRF